MTHRDLEAHVELQGLVGLIHYDSISQIKFDYGRSIFTYGSVLRSMALYYCTLHSSDRDSQGILS